MEEPMADVPERYGRVKVSTLRRDFDRLRVAILAHDSEATEAAWEACERWVDYVFAEAMPAEAMAAEARREALEEALDILQEARDEALALSADVVPQNCMAAAYARIRALISGARND
jgi:vacuolar-type H+-ATPase subunit H